MSNLSNQERRTSQNDTISKTENNPSRDKHAEIRGTGLQTDREQHDHAPYGQPDLSTCPVDQVWDDKETYQGPETHRGIEETEDGAAGMIEVILPIGQRLESVHHRAIEAICRIGENQDDDENVEGAHVSSLPPGQASKLSARKEEMSLGRLNGEYPLALLWRSQSQAHLGGLVSFPFKCG